MDFGKKQLFSRVWSPHTAAGLRCVRQYVCDTFMENNFYCWQRKWKGAGSVGSKQKAYNMPRMSRVKSDSLTEFILVRF